MKPFVALVLKLQIVFEVYDSSQCWTHACRSQFWYHSTVTAQGNHFQLAGSPENSTSYPPSSAGSKDLADSNAMLNKNSATSTSNVSNPMKMIRNEVKFYEETKPTFISVEQARNSPMLQWRLRGLQNGHQYSVFVAHEEHQVWHKVYEWNESSSSGKRDIEVPLPESCTEHGLYLVCVVTDNRYRSNNSRFFDVGGFDDVDSDHDLEPFTIEPCEPGDAVQALYAEDVFQHPAVIHMISAGRITVDWAEGGSAYRVVDADKVFKYGVACSDLQSPSTPSN